MWIRYKITEMQGNTHYILLYISFGTQLCLDTKPYQSQGKNSPVIILS